MSTLYVTHKFCYMAPIYSKLFKVAFIIEPRKMFPTNLSRSFKSYGEVLNSEPGIIGFGYQDPDSLQLNCV